jgi:hypothetical protein
MPRCPLPAALVVLLPLADAARAEQPITPRDREHWAFRAPARPKVPATARPDWVRTPVDAFILARLAKENLAPSAEADRTALLRRLYADLVGLPPTPAEQDAFLNDTRPDAYERLVERLLASPHHGERWAQHWLDVVRYAESNGYEADGERPQMWRYRDYVADSFNRDKPYDRFLSEQIAGDELAAAETDAGRCRELWLAVGMHRLGPVHIVGGNGDREVARQEVLTEMVQGVGAAAFGLTLNCARCHDHKFDPISQADYYRVQAFFAAAQFKDVPLADDAEKAAHKQAHDAWQRELSAVRAEVEKIDAPVRAKLAEAKRAALEPKYRDALSAKEPTPQQKKLAEHARILIKVTWDEILDALTPAERARRAAIRERQHLITARQPQPPAAAMTVAAEGTPPPTHVLRRGEVSKKGDVVTPAFPRVLTTAAPPADKRLTRRDLAAWLTSPAHPLTARVFVNRVWQHHFGTGLVSTPNDFGLNGTPPSHPELLDWLATEFVRSGWSVKHLHRLMVLSSAYRQTSRPSPGDAAAGRARDPGNRLLWHMNRRRLEGEALRDGVLAAAGTLTRRVGGPHVKVPLEPEVYALLFTEGEPDGLWPVTPDAAEHTRRSIYLHARRNVRLPLLEAFDQPDRQSPCATRAVSTFAPQALILMNGPFARQQAQAMAASLWAECGADAGRQVEAAYRRAFARSPRDPEKALAGEFLATQAEELRDRLRSRQAVLLPGGLPADADPAAAGALADFCLALLNSNEFAYAP